MSKTKVEYVCQECASVLPRWHGQCPDCKSWNTVIEQIKQPTVAASKNRLSNRQGMTVTTGTVQKLGSVTDEILHRVSSGFNEFDRVLGGGFVPGGVTLIGGDPGIGKSTLLLQAISKLSVNHPTLYVSGEESLQQIKARGLRLGLDISNIDSISEIELDRIITAMKDIKPRYVIIDSIQTLFNGQLTSSPGSVSQVKECATQLNRFAKETNTSLLIVCHVTKDGELAGPRALEHIVDTVLVFEGDDNNEFRMLRASKNRFGPVNELGVFTMNSEGLQEVSDPAGVFVGGLTKEIGASVFVSYEGNRAILVECQALLDETPLPNPIRRTIGIDANRLQMYCAILHKYAKDMKIYTYNVFLSIMGGLKLTDPGMDVPALLAMISSYTDVKLPSALASFGEVGLTGEIRPVKHAEERIKEAIRLGVKTIITPPLKIRDIHKLEKDIKIIEVNSIVDVYNKVFQK